ncbi:MAG: methyltransferase domain-containing protein [Anaerolineales bacterium]
MHEQIQTLVKHAAVKKASPKKESCKEKDREEEVAQVRTTLTPSPSPLQERGMLMPWNPEQYHKFQSERAAPFYDLLALVDARPNLKAIDLGCGSGELTSQLAEQLPNSDVTGLDSSPEMLTKAASFARGGLVFQAGDLSALSGDWDLIFSNAALQWSGDHEKLIPRLFSRGSSSGQIAIQVPSDHNHISHQICRETADETSSNPF